MKKLLIITQVLDREDPLLGFFVKWIESFSSRVEAVTVICLRKGTYTLPSNVRVLSLGKEEGQSRLKYLWRFFSYIWKERKKYDSVFVHMNQIYVILGGIFWRLCNKRIGLWYAHGKVSFSLRVAEKLTHLCFASTPSGFKLPSKKLRIVGQGIDTHFFDRSEQVQPDPTLVRIVTVGRISPVKRIKESIDVVEEIGRDYPHVRYDIIGVPGLGSQEIYYNDCIEMVKLKGLENHISFLGGMSQERILPRLQVSDIFLNISETGSLDKAILEAMSVGLIAVSSNESFRKLLPDDLVWLGIEPDLSNLKEALVKVIKLSGEERVSISKKLRDIVVRDHGLTGLTTNILSYM